MESTHLFHIFGNNCRENLSNLTCEATVARKLLAKSITEDAKMGNTSGSVQPCKTISAFTFMYIHTIPCCFVQSLSSVFTLKITKRKISCWIFHALNYQQILMLDDKIILLINPLNSSVSAGRYDQKCISRYFFK